MRDITKEIKELDKIRTATKADKYLISINGTNKIIAIGDYSNTYIRYVEAKENYLEMIGIPYITIDLLRHLVSFNKQSGHNIYTDGKSYICDNQAIDIERDYNPILFTNQHSMIHHFSNVNISGFPKYASPLYTTNDTDVDVIRAITSSASSPGILCRPAGTEYLMQVFYGLSTMNKSDKLEYEIYDIGDEFITKFIVHKSNMTVCTIIKYFKLVKDGDING